MALEIGPGITFGGGITFQTEIPTAEVLYDTPGTYSWTAPAGVTSVSVVCIGGGGSGSRGYSPATNQSRQGGGGAGLGWKNNISVTPGQSYTVVVGQGGNSISTNEIIATSSTSANIPVYGNLTLTLDSPTTALQFSNRVIVRPTANLQCYADGLISSYVGNVTMTVNVTEFNGAGGPYSSWNVYWYGNVGSAGGDSYFISKTTVAGLGGQPGSLEGYAGLGGQYVGDGGGKGGAGSIAPKNPLALDPTYPYSYPVGGGSGGSAGGYSGDGGNAGVDGDTFAVGNRREIILPTAGSGGAPGGSWNSTPNNYVMTPPNSSILNYSFGAGSGGSGVGVNGEGASGGYWASYLQGYIMSGNAAAYGVDAGAVGAPGSLGGPSIANQSYPGVGNGFGAVGTYVSNSIQRGGDGGLYGGGGGSVGPEMILDPVYDRIGYGGNGAVRIIWGTGRGFPSNAGPGGFSYRSLLSSTGQAAYDATAYNDWFSVSAQDYANVQAGITGATTIGLSDAEMAQPIAGGLGTENSATMAQNRATVAANTYVLGLVVRGQANANSFTFRPYIGPSFRGNTYGAIGQNSLTVTGNSPLYWLRKNPALPTSLESYVMCGERITNSGESNWALIENTNPSPGATGAAYSNNFSTWTTLSATLTGPAQQWLLTTDVNW